jgi:hypothetical protein
MGIKPGDAVLVVEHRGEQQIVHNALVGGISMLDELLGTKGEPAIEIVFVIDTGQRHGTLSVGDVVHISHLDWIERRAGLGYEELPGPVPGVCRYCRCTEARACPGGCAWIDADSTVCSAPACEEKWVTDNKLRAAENFDAH